jgi:hypothetical protein
MTANKSATKRPAKKTGTKARRKKPAVKSTNANAFARRVGVRRRRPRLTRKPPAKAAATS